MNDNLIKIKDIIILKVKYIYSNLKEKSKFFDYNFFKFMTIILPI